jgi:hypothetical protein
MEMPGWVMFGFVVVVGAMAAASFRFFRSVWRRTHEEGRGLDDEWDPFQ